MFSFAIWDENEVLFFVQEIALELNHFIILISIIIFILHLKQRLFDSILKINTNQEAFSEYLIFQYSISNNTLFDQIFQLQPGHFLEIKNSKINIQPYWDII